MADKRTETISYRLPKSMALDIREVAARQDRSVSDWMFLLARRELYGIPIGDGNAYKANKVNAH